MSIETQVMMNNWDIKKQRYTYVKGSQKLHGKFEKWTRDPSPDNSDSEPGYWLYTISEYDNGRCLREEYTVGKVPTSELPREFQ